MSNNRYIPATEWNNYHTWTPIGGLRHLIFNKDKNGFAKVGKTPEGRIFKPSGSVIVDLSRPDVVNIVSISTLQSSPCEKRAL